MGSCCQCRGIKSDSNTVCVQSLENMHQENFSKIFPEENEIKKVNSINTLTETPEKKKKQSILSHLQRKTSEPILIHIQRKNSEPMQLF